MVPNCCYSVVSVRMAGSNSLIHLGETFMHYMYVNVWNCSVGLRDSQTLKIVYTISKDLDDRFSCKKWG